MNSNVECGRVYFGNRLWVRNEYECRMWKGIILKWWRNE